MPFAVLETGGKQYTVRPGAVLAVEKIETPVGEKITFDSVIMYHDDKNITLGAPTIVGASVTATVMEQFRDKKIRVFKYKPKKRYRRTQGHRQSLSRLKIDSISLS